MDRGVALGSIPLWLLWAKLEAKSPGQLGLLASPLPRVTVGVSAGEVRRAERTTLGHCLTSHQCLQERAALREAGALTLAEAQAELRDGACGSPWARRCVLVGASVTRVLEKRTKRGMWMAVVWLEDERSRCEAACFPRQWQVLADTIDGAGDRVLLLDVQRGDDGQKLVVDGARLLHPDPVLPDDGPALGDFVVLDLETTDWTGPDAATTGPPEPAQQRQAPMAWGSAPVAPRRKRGAKAAKPGAAPAPIAGLGGGLDVSRQRVVEVGLAVFRGGRCVQRLSRLCDPGCPVAPASFAVHGIGDAKLAGQPSFRERAQKLADALRGRVVVTYNGRHFDAPVIDAEFARAGVGFRVERDATHVDANDFVRHRYQHRPDRPDSKRLAHQCAFFGVPLTDAHRAGSDAHATGTLLCAMQRAGVAPLSLARLVRV